LVLPATGFRHFRPKTRPIEPCNAPIHPKTYIASFKHISWQFLACKQQELLWGYLNFIKAKVT
jgi:hypothetical protein